MQVSPRRARAAEVCQWDPVSWMPIIRTWGSYVKPLYGLKVLEVGANRGGISLWFAEQGADVVCTDISLDMEDVKNFHNQFQVSGSISYREEDARNLSFPDNHFDVVCFKSILGNFSYLEQASLMQELHRVLKPGGYLVFAENLKGSPFHRWGRQQFRPWGSKWNYPSLLELQSMLHGWKINTLSTYGFLGILPGPPAFKWLLWQFDRFLRLILPPTHLYIGCGVAQKVAN